MKTFEKPVTNREQEEGENFRPKFDGNGLLTAIVCDVTSGEVLMLAHMNAAALEKTIATGEAHYWSRSRNELWRKGATSGNIQHVEEIRTDCDQDAILLKVSMGGAKAACHTGRVSCFYRILDEADGKIILRADKIV